MLKPKIFSGILFLVLPFFLSSCAFFDFLHDSAHDDSPAPVTAPYGAGERKNENISPQFQASFTDKMVTKLSMDLVMNGLSGKAVKGVFPDKKMKKNSPEEKKALACGKEVMKKLFHAALLHLSPASEYYFVTLFTKDKWFLTLYKKDERLFRSVLLLPSPQPVSVSASE